jgi:diguanylate cyclase (GGDEF)-like protein
VSRSQVTDSLLQTLATELACAQVLLHAPATFAERIVPAGPAESSAAVDALVQHFLGPLMAAGAEPRLLNRVRLKRDGPVLPYRIIALPLDAADPAAGFLAGLRTQAQPAFAETDFARLAAAAEPVRDWLRRRIADDTGLLHWHAFEAEMAGRPPAARACVVYANLDRIHTINEMAGFGAGDTVIRLVGRTWRAQLPRAAAVATHLSGDRFAAVLLDHTLNQARNWAEQTREAIAGLAFGDQCRSITASLGVVVVPAGGAY